MQRVMRAGWIALGVLCGCEQPKPQAERAPAAEAAGSAVIPGTPEGDLKEWVGDMKQGLSAVSESVAGNRAEAHRRVLDLYVTRQEYLEMYYGPTGRMEPSSALAEAVKLNETRFHELMRLTGTTPPVPADSVQAAVAAVRKQLEAVERQAAGSKRRLRDVREAQR